MPSRWPRASRVRHRLAESFAAPRSLCITQNVTRRLQSVSDWGVTRLIVI